MILFFKKIVRFFIPAVAAGVISLSSIYIPSVQIPWLKGKAVGAFDPKLSLVVRAKAYTVSESRLFLSHNLIRQGIRPIELTIENHTANRYSLCPSSLDIPQLSAHKASKKVFGGAFVRQMVFRVAGFFFWPLSIPGTIDGIYTHISQRKLEADYSAKSLKKEGEVIPEYATFHRIIFVDEEESAKEIKIDLIEMESFSQAHVTIPIEEN